MAIELDSMVTGRQERLIEDNSPAHRGSNRRISSEICMAAVAIACLRLRAMQYRFGSHKRLACEHREKASHALPKGNQCEKMYVKRSHRWYACAFATATDL